MKDLFLKVFYPPLLRQNVYFVGYTSHPVTHNDGLINTLYTSAIILFFAVAQLTRKVCMRRYDPPYWAEMFVWGVTTHPTEPKCFCWRVAIRPTNAKSLYEVLRPTLLSRNVCLTGYDPPYWDKMFVWPLLTMWGHFGPSRERVGGRGGGGWWWWWGFYRFMGTINLGLPSSHTHTHKHTLFTQPRQRCRKRQSELQTQRRCRERQEDTERDRTNYKGRESNRETQKETERTIKAERETERLRKRQSQL